MSFLRLDGLGISARRVDGVGVYLRPPELRDHEPWAALRGASRGYLTPWEPTWAEDELSRASFRYRLRRYADDIREGRAYSFLVFRTSDDSLTGGVTLSRVQRGVGQMCALGYWAGAAFAGQGYTTAAVRAVVGFAFSDLALHRVEAACQPNNPGSRRVLEKAGFQPEGFARAYLRINGDWRDHLLFAILSTDPIGTSA